MTFVKKPSECGGGSSGRAMDYVLLDTSSNPARSWAFSFLTLACKNQAKILVHGVSVVSSGNLMAAMSLEFK